MKPSLEDFKNIFLLKDIEALSDIKNSTLKSFWYQVCIDYSINFSTPLHFVLEMSPGDVFYPFFVLKYKDLNPELIQEMLNDKTGFSDKQIEDIEFELLNSTAEDLKKAQDIINGLDLIPKKEVKKEVLPNIPELNGFEMKF
jgi:hypothetical protein